MVLALRQIEGYPDMWAGMMDAIGIAGRIPEKERS
jgi:hypothetical protein